MPATPAPQTPLTVLAGLGVTLLLWASAFVAIRYVDRFVGAGALALGRLLVGSLCLGVVAAVRREPLPHGRALGFSVVCGLLWFGAYNLMLNLGERRLDAGTSALLVNTGPIFLALLAGMFLGEGFPQRLLGGCLVAFCGAALIAVGVASHGSADLWGVVLCIGAALAYAAGVVAQKPALRSASALSVTWAACTVGAVLIARLLGLADLGPPACAATCGPVDALPRGRPDSGGLSLLGLGAVALVGRPPRGYDLPRTANGGFDRLARPERNAALAGGPRRHSLPGGCGLVAQERTAGQGAVR